MAVAEVLVHVRITLLILWLGVFPFVSGWPQIGRSQYHSHPEVLIPLRVTGTGKGMKTPGWLSYSLHFGGQRHIIHMKVKRFLVSRHFPVFTYTDQGALQEDQPYVQSDCYYHGYVEGEPESTVALSSCFGGFQGMLQISDTVYEIKPKRFSATHEHLIYRLHHNETELPSMKCGLTEEQIAQQLVFHKTNNVPLKQSNYEGWWTHRWFIEFAVVVDHQRFLHRDNNASWVLLEVLLVLNEINAFYSAMDVDLGLSGLEIWNQGNLLQENDMEKFLISFCQWKRMAINNRIQHDILHLFIKQNFGIYLGLAYIGTICHQNYNCGVDKFEVDELFPFAHVVAHEIGHNLGMVHDDHACTCGKSTCIMFPAENDSRTFSNCSYASFYEISSRTSCMRNLPYLLKKERQCGNGVVEEGEACDCGSLQMCTKDPCCLTNCTLRPGAVCGFGLCCKDCQFRASGELCREKENECDLPEWCNGIWHECPEDVYKQNGYKCLDIGFCYKKTCNVRDEQCRQIFGKKAKNANQKCYREVNIRGDRFGNCGNDSRSYIGCNIADILCGRIQCENVTIIPYLNEHTTVHSSHISGHECWGTDYHFGMPIPDIGDVKDGTECGEKPSALGKCTRQALINPPRHKLGRLIPNWEYTLQALSGEVVASTKTPRESSAQKRNVTLSRPPRTARLVPRARPRFPGPTPPTPRIGSRPGGSERGGGQGAVPPRGPAQARLRRGAPTCPARLVQRGRGRSSLRGPATRRPSSSRFP
ncbi:disintegrin and metalloproteinase domain-containing protein 21-like [Lepus europaeus]|uniref:disintegrin and metalloproteinase domain-containing protein 21-like n=1 Tax=Lepus europaeus TaxID=9983 RepID=UPI002B4854E0|nr:disintegrin and metalloproteinase domain-containing protein 21-like [Lepus europaeus]